MSLKRREIKFRAWDMEDGEMLQNSELIFNEISPLELTNNQECLHLMEYTGLKDKNGVEIHEGDILKHRNGQTFIVEYQNDRFYAKYKEDSDYSSLFLQIGDKGLAVVIGNIHENKELLNA